MQLKRVGWDGVDWAYMAQWRATVNTRVSFDSHQIWGHFNKQSH